MLRTKLYADPSRPFRSRCYPPKLPTQRQQDRPDRHFLRSPFHFRRIWQLSSKSLAHGLISAGLAPGEVVAIFLPNSWEFAITYHAATLAGGIPTLLNPSYREREIRYQLENSGAVFLDHRRSASRKCEPRWTPRSAPRLHHPPRARWMRKFRQSAAASVNANLPASAKFRDSPSHASSLLQRHHRTAQGRHALALQPRRQCLSDHSARMPRRSRPTTSCSASCRSTISTDSRWR